jgi:hypothetical protein
LSSHRFHKQTLLWFYPLIPQWISLEYFFGIEVDHQPAKIVSRLWLCRRSKSLRLPSWNWPQLDVSGQRRSQGRPSHPDPDDNGLTSNSSIVPGIPPNYDLWDNLRLWFIRFIYDASAKEWGKFFQRDEVNDRRAFKLAEKSNEAMNKLSQAVVMNTKAIENGKAVAEMLNLLRAKLI